MMAVHCSAAVLEVYPSFQLYNDSTTFTSLFCNINVDYNLDLEWLDSNFTPMNSTPPRICGIANQF